ncbi:MAG: GNAT family N-acetyltransferase [Paracoccaceae bacterium]|nr:GNAT family N-acetyltransferase [Paracoccaceae bacterium]
MSFQYDFVETIENPQEFKALMVAYYGDVLPKVAAIGAPVLDPVAFADETLAKSEELLPPRNRLLLVRDASGKLVGCGTLRRIRDDAAEMKRMFVLPEAQGQGLGQRIFEERIAEARRMGLKWLYADTFKGNRAMLSMYEKFGFGYIPRYPENANDEEFDPFLVYLSYEL